MYVKNGQVVLFRMAIQKDLSGRRFWSQRIFYHLYFQAQDANIQVRIELECIMWSKQRQRKINNGNNN